MSAPAKQKLNPGSGNKNSGTLPVILTLGIVAVILIFWSRPKFTLPNHQAPAKSVLPVVQNLTPTTTILLVGDVLLSRNVGAKIDAAKDVALPFAQLQNLLSRSDIAFGNLECPLSDSTVPIRQGLVFRCLTRYVAGLVTAGFDVLGTANNHAFDQGRDQLAFTTDYLKSQNILAAGTGQDFGQAHTAQVLKRNNILYGFLSYSYSAHNDGQRSTDPQIATMDNLEALKNDIWAARGHTADVIIVNMHAGTEYTRAPNAEQIAFAHAAIDTGADVVVGEHPHWIQDIEIYKGRPIFYSLGNFVFDQAWSEATSEGLMVELRYQAQELKSARLLPVIIENNCCPRLATEEEKTAILKKINLDTDTINFPPADPGLTKD